jgi:hypothetical protein
MSLKLAPQPAGPPTIAPLSESRITGGMNTFIDPADLPPNIATVSQNTRTYADYTFRAPGTTLLAGTDPDAKPVLLYAPYKRFDGTTVPIRFTEDRLDKYSSGTWTQITGTLNGAATDRFRIVTTADASADYLMFTNNGVDDIKVLNAGATSFADLGDAPKYRFITVFFNRVVGANLAGGSPNPVQIGWSGDFNFTVWNPLTDVSAGNTPLVEAQADYADPITGLFGFASVMLILRERSLWIATKRPVASNPFQFQAAFPSVGCDTPNSATQTRNGIVWYDFRSNQVYWYEVGSSPRPIGDAVRREIQGAITSKDLLWGSYDPKINTYFLTVPSGTTTNTRIFVFNFETGSWSYDDKTSAYGVYPVDGGASRLSYDQITGTYDGITGTYDNLGITAVSPTLNYIGYTDGKLRYEDITVEAGESIWRSKVFRLPVNDQMISRLLILHEPIRNGSMEIRYKRDGHGWNTYKTVAFTTNDGRTRTYATKLIRATEFQWEVRITTGDTKLLEFRLDISASEEDK